MLGYIKVLLFEAEEAHYSAMFSNCGINVMITNIYQPNHPNSNKHIHVKLRL